MIILSSFLSHPFTLFHLSMVKKLVFDSFSCYMYIRNTKNLKKLLNWIQCQFSRFLISIRTNTENISS